MASAFRKEEDLDSTRTFLDATTLEICVNINPNVDEPNIEDGGLDDTLQNDGIINNGGLDDNLTPFNKIQDSV